MIGVWKIPVEGLHPSAVQTLLSSVLTAAWDGPVIGSHVSIVQASLSSLEITLCEVFPVDGSQTSFVQTLLSLTGNPGVVITGELGRLWQVPVD